MYINQKKRLPSQCRKFYTLADIMIQIVGHVQQFDEYLDCSKLTLWRFIDQRKYSPLVVCFDDLEIRP